VDEAAALSACSPTLAFMPPIPAPPHRGHEYVGTFVAFEGGDGAGKSTQIRLLANVLTTAGRDVVVSREPGGTQVGASIRAVVLHGEHIDARAEALLFAADRAHHVATVIRPALERGAIVLSDRFMDSSIAYQGVARALDRDQIRDLSLWASRGLLPDLTVLLDVDPAQGRTRRGAMHDRLESEGDTFHAAVRQGFLDLAEQAPERYLVLDASRDQHELHAKVASAVTVLTGVTTMLPDTARGMSP